MYYMYQQNALLPIKNVGDLITTLDFVVCDKD